MTPERYRQIGQLYHAALEVNADARAGFLERACAGDAELRREVESLIASHEQVGNFIDVPALSVTAALLAGRDALPGQTIAHYRVESLIGTGGMGRVYVAQDTRLGRRVALKLLPEFLTNDDNQLQRFRQEARAASALNHPNILTIHEIGQTDDVHFIATEFIDGETLRQRMTKSRMTVGEVLDVATQVASALDAAHAAGIVHRDIKPENIMLRPDAIAKVLDFGLAKLANPDPSMIKTTPGMVMGTAAYMSPERARGQDVDARTDIWSFGVVLYEMLTGKLPFAGETASDVIAAILTTEPVALAHLSPDLYRITRKCLEKNRDERYQAAKDLLVDLRQLQRHGQVTPAPFASIAVLPFADLSPQRDQSYFCEGVAEEILNSLTRVEGLRVASRTSSFELKGGEDIRRIGERLNVRCVLEGSVRKAGERLRVTMQLIDAASGYHLWSERYDRKLQDVFAIQDEIAEAVARALKVVLSGQEAPVRHAKQTDIEAYEFYLRGRQFLRELNQDSIEQAREMFERAAVIDPNFALAQTGIADVCSWRVMWFFGSESDLRQAEAASGRALELAPDIAESHASRGLALTLVRRYEEAERHFRQAIELNPRAFEAHYYYARLLFATTRYAESEVMFRKAAELRTDDYQTLGLLSLILRKLGREEEAAQTNREALNRIERRLEINPRDPRAWSVGSNLLVGAGRHEEGRKWIERALALAPADPAVQYIGVCFYSLSGDPEHAIDLLEKMVQSQKLGTSKDWMMNDPDLDAIRSSPRFQAVFSKLP